jgi:HEAT repeat protein
MSDWRFDAVSAAIGAVLAWIAAWAAYRWRKRLAHLRDQIRTAMRRLAGRITASAEQRYRERVAAWASQVSAFSHVVPLERVFVPPPLIPPHPSPNPSAKQPRARKPITWESALNGHPRVAVVGGLASGRTSLLAYLALIHARQESSELLGTAPERLPLYVSLPAMEWKQPAAEEQAEEDEEAKPEEKRPKPEEESPIEQLIRSALGTVGGSSAYASALREGLRNGAAVILADDWDTLDEEQRQEAATWLGQLADELPGNLWIVVAGSHRFAPLVNAGFAPLRLGDWELSHARALLTHWTADLQPAEGETPRDPAPLAAMLPPALQQKATPLELALRCWLFFAHGEMPDGRADVFLKAVDHLLEPQEKDPIWAPADVRAALSQLAFTLQEERRTTASREEIVEFLKAALPPESEQGARAQDQILQVVTRPGGLLRPCEDDRYTFPHPLWQAFLASRPLATLSPDVLLSHLEEPRWAQVVDFYAAVAPMEPVIQAWLSRPDDLWYTRLRTTAHWATFAPPSAKWRNAVMALLARTLLAPDLRLPIRQRIADALLQTGDPGVVYFLRQAAGHSKPEVRATALRALGQLAGEADLPTLEVALEDPEASVREAAVAALGVMANRAAIHRLTRLLIMAEQELRVSAAVALARCGGEAWEILQEAMQEDDLLTRRAAIYGLAEVDRPWAHELLLNAVRNDTEWIVQSAAEMMIEVQESPAQGVVPPLQISEEGWLISWAAERGEPVGRGEAAFPVLLRALREGPPSIRKAAVGALALVGRPEHVQALRGALEDESPEVAAAALEALDELGPRHGIVIR